VSFISSALPEAWAAAGLAESFFLAGVAGGAVVPVFGILFSS
jgi:hypothetical protein